MSVVAGHKPAADSQVFSFGDSTIEITESGLQKRFKLSDNLMNAPEKEVFAVIESLSRLPKESPAERPNLDNFHLVIFPENMKGGFPYNNRIVSMLNPNYQNQSVYISVDSITEKKGKSFILKDTIVSVPYGRLINKDFPGEHTDFKDLPLVLQEDTEVKIC